MIANLGADRVESSLEDSGPEFDFVHATSVGSRPSSSERTRPLRSPRCTRRWSGEAWGMPSGSRPIRCWSGGSRTCSLGPEADPATRYFTLQLAESDLTGSLFGQILGRIERLAWHPT
jgi:hypothetical protein